MRKIILTIAAMFSITLAYADSCSSGQGSLSYQISGCEEQSRACCSGSWCDWGTTSCSNCNDTSAACSVIGSYTGGMASRTVTGSCGSCSYSGWDTSSCSQCGDSQCWNGSSCVEAEATMRNCSGNVSNACAGTQTRTKTCVTGSGWSYGDWTGTCSYTQSCTATTADCNSVDEVWAANPSVPEYIWEGYVGGSRRWNYKVVPTKWSGTARRTVTSSCGTCTYSAWNVNNCSYLDLYDWSPSHVSSGGSYNTEEACDREKERHNASACVENYTYTRYYNLYEMGCVNTDGMSSSQIDNIGYAFWDYCTDHYDSSFADYLNGGDGPFDMIYYYQVSDSCRLNYYKKWIYSNGYLECNFRGYNYGPEDAY